VKAVALGHQDALLSGLVVGHRSGLDAE